VSADWNLHIPHFEGVAAKQAHVDPPNGSFERELGRDGFTGPASHVYHRNPPTAWISVEGPGRPQAFKTSKLSAVQTCPWEATRLFSSAHCKVRYARFAKNMDHLVRNADGDDLLFLHRGTAEFYCDYGHLSLVEGDFLLIPRGTMWRLEGTAEFLIIEATGVQYRLPDRGLLGRHSQFDAGVLARPALDEAFKDQKRTGNWELRVKRRDALTVVCYSFNPLDAIGWKGDLYPVKLNIDDFLPVVSHRVHLAPSAQAAFVTNHFVVASIVPRPFETDPRAMKLPWFHNNDDYDEAMFLHRGNFSSRGGYTQEGDITFHPYGCTHGPQPDALERMFDAKGMWEGRLVMIDVSEPLDVEGEAAELAVEGYEKSWSGGVRFAPDAP